LIAAVTETELLKQNYYTSSGTVLKRKAGLKGTQSLLLFLKGYGVVWATAPSTSSKNRFGGATEPMVWGAFTLYKSPSRLYVKNAEVKEDFISIRTNPQKLSVAVELYKILPKVLYAEHENDEALKLLWNCMLLLGRGAAANAVKFRFYWRLLRMLGLAPSLTCCVSCGAELKENAFAGADGYLCCHCAAMARELPQNAIQLIQSAALLPQEDFFLYAKELKSALLNDESEYMVSFFSKSR